MTNKPTTQKHLEIVARVNLMNLYGVGIFIMGCVTFGLCIYFLFIEKYIPAAVTGLFTVIGWPTVLNYLFPSKSEKK